MADLAKRKFDLEHEMHQPQRTRKHHNLQFQMSTGSPKTDSYPLAIDIKYRHVQF